MAHQAGTPGWNLGETKEKPRLTKKVVGQKGREIAEKYNHVLVALTAAALELAGQKDPLGFKLLAEAAETALGVGVEACAAVIGVDLEE